MSPLTFAPPPPAPEAEALRAELRAFLAAELPSVSAPDRLRLGGRDPAFSRKVAARGWIGMTWPKRYGGRERSALERYVVQEEMLAAGAPVAAHWVADRQSGPNILRNGSEAQKNFFLPRIAAGECSFCIGMSEPVVSRNVLKLPEWRLRLDEDGCFRRRYQVALRKEAP